MVIIESGEQPRQLSKEERQVMTAKLQGVIVRQDGRFDDKGIFEIGSSYRRMFDMSHDRLWSLNLMGLDSKTKRVRINKTQEWLEVYEAGKFPAETQQIIASGNLRSIEDISDLRKARVYPGGWVLNSSFYYLLDRNNDNLGAFEEDNILCELAKGLDSEYHGDESMFTRVTDESLVGKEVYCLQFEDPVLRHLRFDALVFNLDRKFYHRELVYPFLDQSDFEKKNEEWKKMRAIMTNVVLG